MRRPHRAGLRFVKLRNQLNLQDSVNCSTSTRDGHELFRCTDTRYSTNLAPAIDPIDIAINSLENVIELRDITLARTEKEVGREIVLRLPVAERNVSDFKTEAIVDEGTL